MAVILRSAPETAADYSRMESMRGVGRRGRPLEDLERRIGQRHAVARGEPCLQRREIGGGVRSGEAVRPVVPDDEARLVVVECPWGVMRLAQAGVPAVALLGTALSDRQAELLSARHHVALLFDGDPAGRRGAREAARRLELAVDVTIVDLPKGCDPDDLSDTELLARVG